MYVYMCVCVHMCVCIYVCIYVCVCVCTCVCCVSAHVCVCVLCVYIKGVALKIWIWNNFLEIHHKFWILRGFSVFI